MKGKVWCPDCKIEVNKDAQHCEDCEVCIEEYDHHCVFFSKCIGGGNILCFWGAIGGVMFNFLNIAIMLCCTAAAGEDPFKSKSRPIEPEALQQAASEVFQELTKTL